MCKNTFKIVLIFLFFFSFLNYSVAQNLMYEISLSEQVAASSQIVEGKVISKKSFWDVDHRNIFTVNTIEVYKVFKGGKEATIEVVTSGGTVGFDAEVVNPSLNLRVGDIGVFTLIKHSISFDSAKKGTNASFKSYSSKQGFYKYDIANNVVANPYSKREGIKEVFYNELTKLTNKSFSEVKSFNVDKENRLLKKNTANKGVLEITTISPTTSTAGTASELTITGSGFGTEKGAGIVEFPDADEGGATFFEPLDSQIVSWSDTEIVVEIPNLAGTGKVKVTPDGGASMESSVDLVIEYSMANADHDFENGLGLQASPTRLIDRNGNGGYIWQMETGFDANSNAKSSFMRAFNSWVCETEVNWVIGDVIAIDVAENDDINIIRFDVDDELPDGTLGRCTSRLSAECGITDSIVYWFVEELDVVFNDDTNWNLSSSNPTFSQIDFESVAIHELGHGFQLGHVIDSNEIMHYSITNGNFNRTLSEFDLAGTENVFNRSLLDIPSCGVGTPIYTKMTALSCPTASLDDQILAGGVVVYPNPASDKLFITNHTNFNLQKATIFDVSGRLLSNIDLTKFGSTKEISIENLSQGIYFLKINSDKAKTTKRFVVE